VGIRDANFEETAPTSPALVISRLVCSLAGVEQEILIAPDTLAFKAYGKNRAIEQFTCNYGLNESYREDIIRDNLSVVGKDSDGSARIVELASHPLFMATLFLPQLSTRPGNPHPVVLAFLGATETFRTLKGSLLEQVIIRRTYP
jgi:CTP synthase (UTP-ammonia lyase)